MKRLRQTFSRRLLRQELNKILIFTGAVKKLPQQKNRPDVKSERFFGIINYANK